MSGVQSLPREHEVKMAVRSNVVKHFCVYGCFSRKLIQPSVINMKRDKKCGYLRSYLTDLSG